MFDSNGFKDSFLSSRPNEFAWDDNYEELDRIFEV